MTLIFSPLHCMARCLYSFASAGRMDRGGSVQNHSCHIRLIRKCLIGYQPEHSILSSRRQLSDTAFKSQSGPECEIGFEPKQHLCGCCRFPFSCSSQSMHHWESLISGQVTTHIDSPSIFCHQLMCDVSSIEAARYSISA